MFALFLVVLVYHMLTELCFKTKFWKRSKSQRYTNTEGEQTLTNLNVASVTFSEVDPPSKVECPLPTLIDWAEGHRPPNIGDLEESEHAA